MTMFKTLHFKTEYHYPQVERRFSPGFLNDPKNENCWQIAYEVNLGSEFPNWVPSKSYYYAYNSRAKKLWRSRLYSGLTDRLVIEEQLFDKMQKELSLSPFITFDNYIEFKEERINVLSVFFNVDFIKAVDITSSVFEYGDRSQKKELIGLTDTEFADIYNSDSQDDMDPKFMDERYLIAKKVIMRSNFDILTLIPFSGLIFLSPKAINFFEKEGITHLDPWPFKFFEIVRK